jgi:hypothetical protein
MSATPPDGGALHADHGVVESGGAERDRTDDLRLAKPALSQLSYSPESQSQKHLIGEPAGAVGQGRLELPTSRLSGVRSNQLSYWPGLRATRVVRAKPPDLIQAGSWPTLGPWKLGSMSMTGLDP